jgi:hypothetical protein
LRGGEGPDPDRVPGVLENSVAFEKRIRNQWREKSKQKDERIAELAAKVEELEQRLAED